MLHHHQHQDLNVQLVVCMCNDGSIATQIQHTSNFIRSTHPYIEHTNTNCSRIFSNIDYTNIVHIDTDQHQLILIHTQAKCIYSYRRKNVTILLIVDVNSIKKRHRKSFRRKDALNMTPHQAHFLFI